MELYRNPTSFTYLNNFCSISANIQAIIGHLTADTFFF